MEDRDAKDKVTQKSAPPKEPGGEARFRGARYGAGGKPVRGVKRTVSAFTMLFALLCLFAFMAGRVDVAATNQPPKTAKASTSISKAGHKRAVAGRAKNGTARQRAVQASF